ncbi:hypothetical protein COD78_31240, partial [Bacillus cereus]|uniref:Ig-like domain-containing protein n=1 Tax=Bacillus cereus TaxID=1396 RepID=UPI000C0350BF
MKKQSKMNKNLKTTVTTLATAGLLMSYVSPSFAEEQLEKSQEQIAPEIEQENQVLDELKDAETENKPSQDNEIDNDKVNEGTANQGNSIKRQEKPVNEKLVDAKLASEVNVGTFEEFKAALMNVDIRTINVINTFTFKESITDFPSRNITINGNADKGVVINTLQRYISLGSGGKDTFTIENASIVSKSVNSPGFLTSLSDGWSIFVKDVKYDGTEQSSGEFIRNDKGVVTFEGNNNINSHKGNVIANQIIIKSGSTYYGRVKSNYPIFKSILNSQDPGSRSLVIEKNANVNLKDDFNSTGSSLPLFANINNINVGENAKLDVDALGKIIMVSNRDKDQNIFNIESGAEVNLKSRLEKESVIEFRSSGLINVASNATLNVEGYENPISLSNQDSTINVNPDATFIVTGRGESVFKSSIHSRVVLDKPKYFDIKNLKSNKPIFNQTGTKDTVLQVKNSDINVWEKNGEYETPPTSSWENVIYLTTFIKGQSSSNTSSSDADLKANFQMANYGRISGGASETEKVPDAPEVNEVKDTDTKVTGMAKPGSKVTVKVGDQELGTGTADENGKYSIDIPKQPAGTKLSVTASNKAGTSQATEVTVKGTLVSPIINDYYTTDAYARGTAKGASQVALYIDGKLIRTAGVNADGTYSIYTGDVKKLGIAGTVFEVAARDAAGNEGPKAQQTVQLRLAAPTIQDYYTTDAYARGTAKGASKVALYIDGKLIRTAGVNADGTYSIYTGDVAKLQQEGAKFEIAARDAAGNESVRTKGTVLA